MTLVLPTAEELARLPLRAVVAYAARTARRVSSELHGVVPDQLLDEALRLVEAVSAIDQIEQVDKASLVHAGERVVTAYAAAPAGVKSPQRFLMVFSVVQAGLAAVYAILAALNPGSARHQMKRAAQDAERAARPIRALSAAGSLAAMQAARRDYETLVREYGEHDEVVIGDPIDCFDAE